MPIPNQDHAQAKVYCHHHYKQRASFPERIFLRKRYIHNGCPANDKAQREQVEPFRSIGCLDMEQINGQCYPYQESKAHIKSDENNIFCTL